MWMLCLMNNEDLQEMIDEADRDGDGEVNEEEFLRSEEMCQCQVHWLLYPPTYAFILRREWLRAYTPTVVLTDPEEDIT